VTTVVKQKAELVVPQSIRRQAGIKVEFVTLDGLLNDLGYRRRKNSTKAALKSSR
jgi:hypothetical protein